MTDHSLDVALCYTAQDAGIALRNWVLGRATPPPQPDPGAPPAHAAPLPDPAPLRILPVRPICPQPDCGTRLTPVQQTLNDPALAAALAALPPSHQQPWTLEELRGVGVLGWCPACGWYGLITPAGAEQWLQIAPGELEAKRRAEAAWITRRAA